MKFNVADSVNVLGTEYTIKIKTYTSDSAFKKNSIDGYCNALDHSVVICDMDTWPGWEDETNESKNEAMKRTLRHEIIHAFFNESGLQESATKYEEAWARDEQMIDWWAIQGPKVYRAWEQVRTL